MSSRSTTSSDDGAKLESASRVRRHREVLRARGLRPITCWVPDTRNPEFVKQYRVQIGILEENPEGAAFWEWMDQVACTEGWVWNVAISSPLPRVESLKNQDCR